MPDTKAKIGDTIRIIEGICDGDEFRVIECPEDKINVDKPGYIWCVAVDDEEDSGYFIQETKYQIIGQSSKSPYCVMRR